LPLKRKAAKNRKATVFVVKGSERV
jgi:hypothetical protein